MAFPHPVIFKKVPRRQSKESVRDGYKRIKDVYIPTRDGSELCGNIYLPTNTNAQQFPVLLTLGPYGKDIHFSEFGKPETEMYANMAKAIVPLGPDACFETPDPIVWCKAYGYAVVRIDTRGSGGSPGVLDPFGIGRTVLIGDDSEGKDCYDAIEWAGTQDWSSGKVAMCGISYYGMACYCAAMQQPPHLSAIVPYEALTDTYGDVVRQGVVWHSGFQEHWYNNIVIPQQYGKLEGLSEEQLLQQRFDYEALATNWVWRSEGPWPILDGVRALSKIRVPMLTAGSWMDSEVHLPEIPRDAYRYLESRKYVCIVAYRTRTNHLAAYYEFEQIQRQLKFLDHFLKDKKDNGLAGAPRIDLLIRNGNKNFYRAEKMWPPADAVPTPLYLAPNESLLFDQYTASSPDDLLSYAGMKGVNFFQTEPLKEDLEILGFPHLELTVSTDAKDMDIFIYFYIIDSNGEKIVFRDNHDEPAVSFLRSWFRLSHRTLSSKSSSARPVLNQMEPAIVEADKWYEVKIPVVYTSTIIERGYRLAIAIRADDEEEIIPPMRHTGPDRPQELFSGTNRIKLGGRLVLPIVERH